MTYFIITMDKPSHTYICEIKLYSMDDKIPNNFSKGFESTGIDIEEVLHVINTPVNFKIAV